MSDQQTPPSQFSIQRIYVKDLSFESPRAPEVFRGGWQPEIRLEMNTQHRAIEGDLHEVILAVTITAEMEEGEEMESESGPRFPGMAG